MQQNTESYAGVGTAELMSNDDTEDFFAIHGVAIGSGDVTVGMSGKPKVWTAEALKDAAETLEGKPLVKDHTNSIEGKIGFVSYAEFVSGVGVVYEAMIADHYDTIANDIDAGILDVSPRVYHPDTDELEWDESEEAWRITQAVFDNLSVVNNGASPSNSVHPGDLESSNIEAADMSAVATLSTSIPDDYDPSEDIPELSVTVEDTPTDGDQYADTAPDGIYTADGDWFGIAPDEHDDEYTDHPDDAKYPLTSCTGDESIESAWMLATQGDYSIDESTLKTRIRRAAKHMGCDPGKVGLDSWDEMKMYNDNSNVDAPTYSEGDWIRIRASPDTIGKVVHVDREKKLIMANHYEKVNNKLKSTGHTLGLDYDTVEKIEYETESMMDLSPDHKDVFDNEDDAIARALSLGLGAAVHTHEIDGDVYYMPGEDHSSYKEAVDEMAVEYTMHEPYWEETAQDVEFEPPAELSDWSIDDDWSELSDVQKNVVSEHYLLSESGFPPKSFDDLHCMVVTPDGVLALDLLEAEMEKASEYPDDVSEKITDWVEETMSEEFESDEYSSVALAVASLGAADAPRAYKQNTNTDMTVIDYQDVEELDDLPDIDVDNPVLVDEDELSSLVERAESPSKVVERIEELSDKLEEQDEANETLAGLDDEDIEMLESSDDVTVVDSETADTVSEVRGVLAEELADAESDMFSAEELREKYTATELHEKIQEHSTASLSGEITDTEPEPEADGVNEEELEENDEDDESQEEELRQKYAQDLESRGWDGQAQKVRNGELEITTEDN
jgi:hypothetical protein